MFALSPARRLLSYFIFSVNRIARIPSSKKYPLLTGGISRSRRSYLHERAIKNNLQRQCEYVSYQVFSLLYTSVHNCKQAPLTAKVTVRQNSWDQLSIYFSSRDHAVTHNNVPRAMTKGTRNIALASTHCGLRGGENMVTHACKHAQNARPSTE